MIRKKRIKKICIVYCGIFFIACALFICQNIVGARPGIGKEGAVIIDYERMSVREFAEHKKIDPLKIIDSLKINGIRVKNADHSIEYIATENQMLPKDIYEIMMSATITDGNRPDSNGAASKPDSGAYSKRKNKKDGLGKGYGQKTLQDICNDLNIPLEKAQKRLKAKGIVADNTAELRDIAAKYNVRPRDIVDIIKTKKKWFFGF
ncbi:MAG: hypothetical protein ACMUIP_12535 [bacterium]